MKGAKEKNEFKRDRNRIDGKKKKMYGQFLREMLETVDEDNTC